jgi:hypothetical protein
VEETEMIRQILSNMIAGRSIAGTARDSIGSQQIFAIIFGYEGIKRAFIRSLNSKGPDKKAADEITISVWEQLPNPNIRNCVQIGRLVKNERDIAMAI